MWIQEDIRLSEDGFGFHSPCLDPLAYTFVIYFIFVCLFSLFYFFLVVEWCFFRHFGFCICSINQCGLVVFYRITTWRRQWKWEIFLRNFEGSMAFDLRLFLVSESMFSLEGFSSFLFLSLFLPTWIWYCLFDDLSW